jgi:hypothetical protein
MPRAEYLILFEALRDFAQSRNSLLIVGTGTTLILPAQQIADPALFYPRLRLFFFRFAQRAFAALLAISLRRAGLSLFGSGKSTPASNFRKQLRNLIFVRVSHLAKILIVGKLTS